MHHPHPRRPERRVHEHWNQMPRPGRSQLTQCSLGFAQLAWSWTMVFSILAEPYQSYFDYLLSIWVAALFGPIYAAVMFAPAMAIAAIALALCANSTGRVIVRGIHIRLGTTMLLLASLASIGISILALRNAASSGQPGLSVSTIWDLNNIAIHATLASPIPIAMLAIILIIRRLATHTNDGSCKHCGYPLMPGKVCSECGIQPDPT